MNRDEIDRLSYEFAQRGGKITKCPISGTAEDELKKSHKNWLLYSNDKKWKYLKPNGHWKKFPTMDEQ